MKELNVHKSAGMKKGTFCCQRPSTLCALQINQNPTTLKEITTNYKNDNEASTLKIYPAYLCLRHELTRKGHAVMISTVNKGKEKNNIVVKNQGVNN